MGCISTLNYINQWNGSYKTKKAFYKMLLKYLYRKK